MIWYDGLVLIW